MVRAVVGCVGVAMVSLTASDQRADAASVDRVEPAAGVGHLERSPVWLRSSEKERPPVLVYPSTTAGKQPLVVMLHGMCDVPENECPSFAGAATGGKTLLCPQANLRCDGGGTLWSGDGAIRTRLLEDFVGRAAMALPDRVDLAGSSTLVGFSWGSFAALDVAQRTPGRWKNLILLGARLVPDAKKLREAGVENVVLGAGEHDMVKNHMVRVAGMLQAQGIRTTFISLGKVGHQFAPDMDAWLAGAFAWIEQRDAS